MSSILIVEDDRSTCLFLAETLKAAGFTVASAKDGVDALKCLGAGSYDLMLLDVLLHHAHQHGVLAQTCEDELPAVDLVEDHAE